MIEFKPKYETNLGFKKFKFSTHVFEIIWDIEHIDKRFFC